MWLIVQVAAGDGHQHSKQAATEVPSYVDCQTNIMHLTKDVAQIVQEMVRVQARLCARLLPKHRWVNERYRCTNITFSNPVLVYSNLS